MPASIIPSIPACSRCVKLKTKLRFGYKYRLYPTSAQIAALTHHLHEACDLYNCALEERRGAWKTCRKSINYFDQANQLKAMRAEGLIELPNYNCCQDVLRRLDKTFAAFFARIKRGEKPGFPRFKPARRYDSLTFPRYGSGCKLIDRHLRIQGVGEIKVRLHRPIEGNIKNVCVKREAGRWFAVFLVERDTSPLPPSAQAVGIDVGLSSFATLSDGTVIENPRFYREAHRALRVAQRRASRRKNGSKRHRKAVLLIARAHAHIKDQRNDFQHKAARQIVNRYGLIVVEDLNLKGMSRGNLAKSVYDAGWSSFFNKVAYKAENAGRELLKVDPHGTSQTCICGQRVAKTIFQRRHFCSSCGLEGDRDHVSAQVILRLGLSLQALTPALAGVV